MWRAPPPSQLPGPTRGHHCATVRELSCLAATGRRMHPLRAPHKHTACVACTAPQDAMRLIVPYSRVPWPGTGPWQRLPSRTLLPEVASRLSWVCRPPPSSPPIPTRPRHKQHRVLHAHRQHCLTFCVPHTNTGRLIRVVCLARLPGGTMYYVQSLLRESLLDYDEDAAVTSGDASALDVEEMQTSGGSQVPGALDLPLGTRCCRTGSCTCPWESLCTASAP